MSGYSAKAIIGLEVERRRRGEEGERRGMR
jgi:hypothetical protein